jgi:hypothetical protein
MTNDDRSPARSIVDELRVGSPCFESWDRMRAVDGESPDRVRHCVRCDKSVFNVSAMPRDEAEAFLVEKSGMKTCVRFVRRDDDTVVTSDCPMTRSQKRVVLRTIAATAAVTTFVGAGAAVFDEYEAQSENGGSGHGAVVALTRAVRSLDRKQSVDGAVQGMMVVDPARVRDSIDEHRSADPSVPRTYPDRTSRRLDDGASNAPDPPKHR